MAGEESGRVKLELNLGVLTQYSARYTVGDDQALEREGCVEGTTLRSTIILD